MPQLLVQLQEARHDADYNRATRFTWDEALDLAEITDLACLGWEQWRCGLQADTIPTSLLTIGHMKG